MKFVWTSGLSLEDSQSRGGTAVPKMPSRAAKVKNQCQTGSQLSYRHIHSSASNPVQSKEQSAKHYIETLMRTADFAT